MCAVQYFVEKNVFAAAAAGRTALDGLRLRMLN